MEYAEWEPVYRQIAAEFGFSPPQDAAAARRLWELVKLKRLCPPSCLRSRIGEEVTVCGDAPSLEVELRRHPLVGTVIAADGATSVLLHSLGRVPDLIVTDLDGDVVDQLSANAQGAVAVVHAHGDNVEATQRYVPRFQGLLAPTTQVAPFEGVHNYGGFTDGDRAVLLACHFGARRVHLLGFDFNTPRPKAGRDVGTKRRKLAWARRLIFELAPPGVAIEMPAEERAGAEFL